MMPKCSGDIPSSTATGRRLASEESTRRRHIHKNANGEQEQVDEQEQDERVIADIQKYVASSPGTFS